MGNKTLASLILIIIIILVVLTMNKHHLDQHKYHHRHVITLPISGSSEISGTSSVNLPSQDQKTENSDSTASK
ncbi:MAG: hypothetical protein NTX05_09075 [Fusobacteria bacterium]|nr:hypothetical protein [Fusobacteriota bacterium]